MEHMIITRVRSLESCRPQNKLASPRKTGRNIFMAVACTYITRIIDFSSFRSFATQGRGVKPPSALPRDTSLPFSS